MGTFVAPKINLHESTKFVFNWHHFRNLRLKILNWGRMRPKNLCRIKSSSNSTLRNDTIFGRGFDVSEQLKSFTSPERSGFIPLHVLPILHLDLWGIKEKHDAGRNCSFIREQGGPGRMDGGNFERDYFNGFSFWGTYVKQLKEDVLRFGRQKFTGTISKSFFPAHTKRENKILILPLFTSQSK